MSDDLKTFTLEAGTVIKLHGIPFKLEQETKVLGTEENMRLAEFVAKSFPLTAPSGDTR